MGEKRALYTWAEWERLSRLGLVYEPEYNAEAPSTGIECPNPTGLHGGICRSHLYDRPSLLHDLPLFTIFNGERRRYVCCSTCGWRWHRRIARGRPGNGSLTG